VLVFKSATRLFHFHVDVTRSARIAMAAAKLAVERHRLLFRV
jgi:hypothetical protein